MWYKFQKYLSYKRKARNEYSLHSPFMFDLYNAVFKKARRKNSRFAPVEELRSQLLRNHHTITVTDLGAGSQRSKMPVRSIGHITRHTSKSPKYARFMALLAQYLQSKNIIELGTSVGISTAYLALANRNSTVYTIEGCPAVQQTAVQHFKRLQLDNVRALCGPFDEILPPLLGELKNFDLLFVDGNHTYDATLRYFKLALNYAHNGSVMIFDDIYWSEGMTRAWREISMHESVTASVDAFEFGIAFFRKELSKQHFVLKL